jgi:hypothetical protein
MMEIDPKVLEDIVRTLIQFAKKIEAEMLAQATALQVFVQSDPDFDVKKLIEMARKNPKIAEVLDGKYDEFEREVIESIRKRSLDQDIAGILRDWKPSGPVN